LDRFLAPFLHPHDLKKWPWPRITPHPPLLFYYLSNGTFIVPLAQKLTKRIKNRQTDGQTYKRKKPSCELLLWLLIIIYIYSDQKCGINYSRCPCEARKLTNPRYGRRLFLLL
jgi:hypothetical protein